MFWIMILAFVALITVAILIYLSPGESTKVVKKKKENKPSLMPDTLKPVAGDKDWKSIAERWEKNNANLMMEIEKLKANDRQHAKQAQEIEDQKKELLDKLGLEKSWREKEQVTLDKSKQHEKDLKEQIFRTENDLEKEHGTRLRVERELQELKIKQEAVVEEKRQLSVKAASLETTVEALKRDLKELRVANAKLQEKREDVQWVAKAEFDELKSRYQVILKEVDKLKGPA